jgi:hypothetical protein
MRKLNLGYLAAITSLLIGFNQNTSAQDLASKELKLYTNFAWQFSERTVGFDTILNKQIQEDYFETSLGYFSPAFSWSTSKGNKHEIELSRLQFNQVEEVTYIDYNDGLNIQVFKGERKTNAFIALRYEFDYEFFKKSDKRLKPSLGFAARPYYSNTSIRPQLSNQFSSSQQSIATLFSIVPRLTCNVGKRCFLDLNVPLNFAAIGLHTTKINNPAIPVNQRTITTFIAETTPREYLIRLGFGFRI